MKCLSRQNDFKHLLKYKQKKSAINRKEPRSSGDVGSECRLNYIGIYYPENVSSIICFYGISIHLLQLIEAVLSGNYKLF